jgi:hypothetical protein
MSLRIVRGPLEAHENDQILGHYNRLTQSQIPVEEYLHWVERGPDGPAWHAILENDATKIVGHSALIPMRGHKGAKRVLAGKAEYAFVLEEYQTAKIRGLENLRRPRNAIMIQQLFQHCERELGPLLISTNPGSRRSLASGSCASVGFSVSECLLILRPWNAARRTPNLRRWQGALLLFAGVVQWTAWSAMLLISRAARQIRSVPIDSAQLKEATPKVRFFDDEESMKWRYPQAQYERITPAGEPNSYVIVKKGSPDRYLRVCQWRLGTKAPSFALIARLAEIALEEKAMGVRWAAYAQDAEGQDIPSSLKSLGFLCARRDRTLLIQSTEPVYLSSDTWSLTDSMFSFDP